MIFLIVAIVLVVVVTLLIFSINPKKSNNFKSTTMFDAENTNSCENADERYNTLHEAKIDGTYLSNKNGKTLDGQEKKRL